MTMSVDTKTGLVVWLGAISSPSRRLLGDRSSGLVSGDEGSRAHRVAAAQRGPQAQAAQSIVN